MNPFELTKKLNKLISKYTYETLLCSYYHLYADDDSYSEYVDRYIFETKEWKVTIFYDEKLVVCVAYNVSTDEKVYPQTLSELENLVFKKGK